ncbi:MAG: hypothetical protein HQ582_34235, partial [Planctomycetes bacterium]|nr:hypothetical protein [Planctomycetota bacterium]
MQDPSAPDRSPRPQPAVRAWRVELPSWLVSLALHALVLLVLGLTLRLTPAPAGVTERTAEVGIALKRQDGDAEYYETQDDRANDNSTASEAQTTAESLSDFLSSQSPVDPTPSLPAAMNIIGPAALADGGVPNAGGLPDGSAGRRGAIGKKGQATLFGITAEGWKFVYVFDRSESMNWHDRRPLKAAKAELQASLQSLDQVHQFQIIFYNQDPDIFNPSGQRNKLAFATEQNKNNAHRFIRGITATGGTEHVPAIMLAIKLQPDVVFFLTDADEPALSNGQL